MTVGRRSLLLILLLPLTLAGCIGAKQSLPLQSGDDSPGFPAGYEVHASLQISQPVAQEHYVLAMSTVNGGFSAIFLTPQGIPVYRVEKMNGHLHIKRHKLVSGQVNPLQILAYLELIYRKDDDIQALLRDSWRWDTSTGTRRFYRAEASAASAGEISIRYTGLGPWHPRVSLADKRNDRQLTVHVLEAILVLPE